MIEAARRFEDRGQVPFATYATLRIRGAMIDQMRRSAHIARSAMHRRRKYREVRALLSGELGRTPTDVEMAARLDMPLKEYLATLGADQAVFHESLDDVYSDREAFFADGMSNALDDLESKGIRDALTAAVKALPQREAMVLQLFFVEGLTLQEIGRTMGVGAARICQIKKAALGIGRANLNGWIEP